MNKEASHQHIIENARKLFFRFGYSRITVDEIARVSAISKKTIYNHFNSKRDLLHEVVNLIKEQFTREVAEIHEHPTQSWRERSTAELTLIGAWLTDVTYFAQDIRIHEKETWTILNKFKKDVAIQRLSNMLREGTELGELRTNANHQMALLIFLVSAENLLDPEFRESLPQNLKQCLPNTPDAIFKGIIDIIFEGLKNRQE